EDEPVTAMALQPTGDNTLLAAAAGGLYRWDGMAGQWHREGETPGGLVALEATGDILAGVDAEARLWLRDAPGSAWRTLTGPWAGQAVLRVLLGNTAADGASEPALTVLTARPTEQGHYAMTVWQRSGDWRELAALAADIPAALALWPQGRDLFLALQHRVVRLFTDPASGDLAVAQYFFAEGEQVTALACGTARLWAATTAALYRGDATGAQWTLVGALPGGAPVIALTEEAGRLTAVTLGGGCWRAEVADE
ncbi:MAG TPA: hypothetical protein VNK95_10165, partial [Caldilineaceae bacterium]|nr:hypothetical protein [Caldilineaceae bacterium]